jgi:hypothetical protein
MRKGLHLARSKPSRRPTSRCETGSSVESHESAAACIGYFRLAIYLAQDGALTGFRVWTIDDKFIINFKQHTLFCSRIHLWRLMRMAKQN